jgi:hypothetical protein
MEAPALLYGPIEEMFRAINETRDSDFLDVVSEYVDLQRFVSYLAVETFLSDIDGFLGDWGPNNFYLYRFEKQTVSTLLPWDKDSAFQDHHSDITRGIDRTVLSKRVLARREYYQLYLRTLLACAQAAETRETPESATGWLEAELAREVSQIRASAYADGNKWYTNERFEDEVAKMFVFVRERSPFVASEAQRALDRLQFGAR